jgi:uncharacterized protein (TIGR00288 family)
MTPQQHNHLPRPVHKEPPAHAPNAALLIDFDNVTMGIRSDLQSELKRLLQSEIIRGKVAVQRAYADWRRYPQYIVPLSESSIDLIFAPAYGSNKKNATDIRLAIDALELVFTRPEIGTFILLSGDSDFSSLVLKLKEYGKYVIGVGIRESSSDLLIQNCDEYYSYNELAGFTKESEVEYVRRDPWELVVEAVKQMTAHNDVMRSDRLKQVMQEIDPNFDEKDAGFSRFSKFVIEAAHRGLITLTRLDNGQYEIALGPQVVGALAQPALGAGSVSAPPVERAPREREGRGRRGGRGGRGREEREHRDAPAEPVEPAAAAAPAASAERKSGFSFGEAFGLLKQAIGRMGGEDRPVSAEELRDAMAEIKTDAPPLETAQVQKLLRQAHDKEMIDLAKEDEGYTVKLRADQPPAPPAAAAAEGHVSEEDDIPMPASSAPPPPYSAHPPSPGGVPARSGRFRRGSRGPRVAPPAPDIPKIGVVEVDPNFRPRIDLVPPTKPPGVPLTPEPTSGEGRRGGSGRGGRGAGRAPAGDREERGERGERGGRNRRGGRGRARGGRGGQGRDRDERPAPRSEAPAPPPPAPPATPPPPAPAPRPRAPEPEADGESFWSKVKRGLTGGA